MFNVGFGDGISDVMFGNSQFESQPGHRSCQWFFCFFQCFLNVPLRRPGNAVAQLVEALRYKLEGCGFDSRWCHWIFSLT